jgi:hypothetical protein
MENAFNIAYLFTVWALVALMVRGRKRVAESDIPLAGRFLFAFILLAAGDSFHVGFRVLAALSGTEATTIEIGGLRSSLVGLGMLATAYTMTVFYMVLADARRVKACAWLAVQGSGKKKKLVLDADITSPGASGDAAFWIMQILLGLRLVLMALPGNGWETQVPPYAMGLARNLPLAIAGFLMATLFVLEGRRGRDKTWAGIGWAMFASYAFYTPVILFAASVPALGLLMIPKTIAYLVMGFMAYRRYWRPVRKA